MEELAKTVDVLVKNWLMVLWSLTHSLFSLSRSLSLYLSLFLYPVSLTLLPVTLSASLTAISTSAFCNSKQKLFLKNKIQRECILLCVISFLCAKSSSALNLHLHMFYIYFYSAFYNHFKEIHSIRYSTSTTDDGNISSASHMAVTRCRYADVVKKTCWNSNWKSKWGRKVI